MSTSTKITAAAALTGVALALSAFVAAPFLGSARAASDPAAAVAADRIGGAFSMIAATTPSPAVEAAAVAEAKGDLLLSKCAAATWPDIGADCLVKSDGSPVGKARMVTIGYQADATTTVLTRVPSALVAAR